MNRRLRMRKRMTFFFVFTILISLSASLYAQSKQYVITFTDKQSNYSLDRPEEFLSERAINRRKKQGIGLTEADLPISSTYMTDISSIPGLVIKTQSKWFNDVVIQLSDTAILSKIREKDYVKGLFQIPQSEGKSGTSYNKKLEAELLKSEALYNDPYYGLGHRQITMLNGDYLHSQGYRGENTRIAIIDAGYDLAWSSEHFKHLYSQKLIVDEYDFVDRDKSVYEKSRHGTYVLSTMGAYTPGSLVGTAPFAEYLLLRSEDGALEYVVEEYFWTAAAEFADSAGADLINSSLGYSTFTDSLQNHTYADMNGKTTRISLSASKASETGMLVFTSAGNEGDKSWQKITAPADAELAVTVGAVDSAENVAFFSSRGPTFDNRIKPDVMAMGMGVVVGTVDGGAALSNGTSFSSPVLAGMTACLWQANPDKDWTEVKAALIKSADRFNTPDTNYGYGIPDMIKADQLLKGLTDLDKTGNESVRCFPNPFETSLMIVLNVPAKQEISIEIYNEMGQRMGAYKRLLQAGNSYVYFDKELSNLGPGLYIMKLNGSSINQDIKVMKR